MSLTRRRSGHAARVAALLAAAVVLTGCVRPLGVYRSGGGIDAVQEYEQFLGRPVNQVTTYLATENWDQQTWPDWQARMFAQRPDWRVVIGSQCFPQGGSWEEAATGAYNGQWQRLGERLVASGQDDAYLRFCHEFNEFFHYYPVNSGNAAAFAEAWRQWATVMRSVPGQHFTLVWNPSLGTTVTFPHPEEAWPGDAYVDQIGLDVYDAWYRGWRPHVDPQPSQQERDRVWEEQILGGERGLAFWRSFAAAHGDKWLAFPEWGLQLWMEPSDGLHHGGGDNPWFIKRMHEIISHPAWNVAWHDFWEDEGRGLMDPDDSPARTSVGVPLSRYVFRNLFHEQ
jgi:hypothetical protein